ncbi:exo-alpha-sialidase [Neobacillus mesonae]|uniref:exo-alpha-sialidase n=1 Tax=Neobacillus mesonae TaxID=1193713 RepID=UPI002E1F53B6|nr:exo-alpha-sialidase [Neobacillus mesonae]
MFTLKSSSLWKWFIVFVLIVPLSPWIQVSKSNAAADVLLDYEVNKSFNGKTDYLDKKADVQTVSGLTQGSITAKFKTTSSAAAKAIISASDTKAPSSNITLSVNGSNLYFENREDGKYATQITASGHYNDGNWHTAVITVDASGTKFYVDGYLMATHTSKAFFSHVTKMDSMYIGRNVDDRGGEWYYDGDIENVKIYDRALTVEEVVKISGNSDYSGIPAATPLFEPGMANANSYRIPSMITTQKGTIIAAADVRRISIADSPNEIDTGIRRSTDNGKTWSDLDVIIDYPGSGANAASTIDASMLQDRKTGTIWLLVDHFPGGVGFGNAAPGKGFDANGNKILTDQAGNEYSLRENGEVFDKNGVKTDYKVAKNGDVTLNGEKRGNIYLKKGVDPKESLLEARTAFLQIIKSDDDGKTWSEPIDLNSQVKESWMKFIGTGPGNGIQVTKGEHEGRLIFPIYYTNTNVMQSSAVIYSDDNGKTWKRGKSPNDGRVFNGKVLQSETTGEYWAQLTENQVIELENGDLRLYMRNVSGNPRVAIAESTDGGASWGAVTFDQTLLDPYCQSTVINYPDLGDGKKRVIFANPASTVTRANGTVRVSEDGGKTWKYSMLVKPGGYAYSSLTVLPDGKIGLLYENNAGSILFTSFSLYDVTKEDAVPPVIELPDTIKVMQTEEVKIPVVVKDPISGVQDVQITLDGKEAGNPVQLASLSLPAGTHLLQVTAVDVAGNESVKNVNLEVELDIDQLDEFLAISKEKGWITHSGILNSLDAKIQHIQAMNGQPDNVLNGLKALENEVKAQDDKKIAPECAQLLLDSISYMKTKQLGN